MVQVLQKSASLFKSLLDVVMPPVCYVCGQSCSSKYGLCDICLEKIRKIPPPYCPKCGRHVRTKDSTCHECAQKKSHLERAWSSCDYKDTIKESIHLFKYNGYVGLLDVFTDILSDFIKQNRIGEGIDLLVPVPIYSTKKRERTFNHAELLARSLSRHMFAPVDTKNLKKIKWTSSQSELDKGKRLKNVKDAFLAVDKKALSGKNVMIVDDVFTTGATINECAKTLLESGANKIFSLTLARG